MFLGVLVGGHRRVSSRARGLTAKDTGALDTWTMEIEGACAEIAVAKLTGTYWWAYQSGRDKAPDSGSYHVRHTCRDDGCLILHHDDPDAMFVLVTGRAPDFEVRGAIRSVDGRDPRYWRTNVPHPAYFVPASALAPLRTEAT